MEIAYDIQILIYRYHALFQSSYDISEKRILHLKFTLKLLKIKSCKLKVLRSLQDEPL